MKTGRGRPDYLLSVDKKVVGVIDAKPQGATLAGVEWQSAMDATGLPLATNTIGGRGAAPNGNQSMNLASISLSMIRRMPVVVPLAEVSSVVVTRLVARLEAIDRLEQAVHLSGEPAPILRTAILASAFEGKLTGRRADTEVIESKAAGCLEGT